MNTSLDAGFCGWQQFVDIRFHCHGLQTRRAKQLLLCHPANALIRRRLLDSTALSGIGFNHSDDVEQFRKLSKRGHLPGCMAVFRSDLPDLDRCSTP